MSEFIVKIEDFHFGIMEKTPTAYDNDCILLYREENGGNGSILIDSNNRPQSQEIRRGKFNKKAILSLSEKIITQKSSVLIKDTDFYFDIVVSVSYALQNVKNYYFQGRNEGEEAIRKAIKQVIKKCDEEWSLKEGRKLEFYLEDKLKDYVTEFSNFKIKVREVSVSPDIDAQRMIQSDKTKTIGIHTYTNQTEEKIAYTEQDSRLKDSQNILFMKELEKMGMMMQNFGALGPIVDEYLQGKLSGEELYNYIMKNKTSDLNVLSAAMESDLLTQEDALEQVGKLLNDKKYIYSGSGNNQEIRIEQQDAENTEEVEQYTPADGDYL